MSRDRAISMMNVGAESLTPTDAQLNQETNLLFWERTKYKPGKKLDMKIPADKKMAIVWSAIKRELAAKYASTPSAPKTVATPAAASPASVEKDATLAAIAAPAKEEPGFGGGYTPTTTAPSPSLYPVATPAGKANPGRPLGVMAVETYANMDNSKRFLLWVLLPGRTIVEATDDEAAARAMFADVGASDTPWGDTTKADYGVLWDVKTKRMLKEYAGAIIVTPSKPTAKKGGNLGLILGGIGVGVGLLFASRKR